MYLHFTPRLLHWLYPDLVWHMPRTSKTIYLTFDDGPIPGVTPWVLETLATYGAKATFFCVGDNIQRNPEILQQVLNAGHRLGNHTYHHLKGLKSTTADYLQDTAACQQLLQPLLRPEEPKLFRPPYGLFSKQQRQQLQQEYNVVMWDVLSADYDTTLSAEACLHKSIHYTQAGSIIVFHDSLKAWKRLHWALPRYLQYFHERGFSFASL